jgi:hypothetical protein
MTHNRPIVLLSLIEWQNLLAALNNPIERYGIDAVLEAVEYLAERGDKAR